MCPYRMAKTFDNISEASATNYLFLFAQRTLALQNEPPTPPPLNVLGLPCHAMSLLWEKAVKKKPAEEAEQVGLRRQAHREVVEAAEAAEAAPEVSDVPEAPEAEAEVPAEAASAAAVAEQAAAETGQAAAEAETPLVPEVPEAAEVVEVVDKEGEDKRATFTEKIEQLAKKITEYILDHQDDAAQEDRWRTTMKREMVKSFRVQREASETSFRAQREENGKQREEQREAIDRLDSRFDMQREAIDRQGKAIDEMHKMVKDLANDR